MGPTKTAVMLFAPAKGQPPLAEGDLVWGSTPLPVVRAYKYLGVMLAADCKWDDHVSYVVDNATRKALPYPSCTITEWQRPCGGRCCWRCFGRPWSMPAQCGAPLPHCSSGSSKCRGGSCAGSCGCPAR